ncbi:hypothetical protein [Ligilactobacillus apodemi]|nr:hypothetical protein [Ligilactobacillus apodemi]
MSNSERLERREKIKKKMDKVARAMYLEDISWEEFYAMYDTLYHQLEIEYAKEMQDFKNELSEKIMDRWGEDNGKKWYENHSLGC